MRLKSLRLITVIGPMMATSKKHIKESTLRRNLEAVTLTKIWFSRIWVKKSSTMHLKALTLVFSRMDRQDLASHIRSLAMETIKELFREHARKFLIEFLNVNKIPKTEFSMRLSFK
jgi:hypothetical protein